MLSTWCSLTCGCPGKWTALLRGKTRNNKHCDAGMEFASAHGHVSCGSALRGWIPPAVFLLKPVL